MASATNLPTEENERPESGTALAALRRDLDELLVDGPVCLVAKRPGDLGPENRSVFARKFTDAELAVAHVARSAARHGELNFYVVRNPSGRDLYRKGKSGELYAVAPDDMGNPPRVVHLTRLRWLAIDIDPRGADHEAARASALAALDALGIPLWFVMDSGRGVQAQVRLEVPDDNTPESVALFKACARAIYDRLAVDRALCQVDSVQNPNRQSRLVGMPNTKTGRLARLLREERRQVPSLAALAAALGIDATRVSVPGEAGKLGYEHVDEKLADLGWDPSPEARRLLGDLVDASPDLSALSVAGRRLVEQTPPRPGDESVDNSDVDLQLARALLEGGEPMAGVLGALAQPGRHCAGQANLERAMARCVTCALHRSGLSAAPEMSAEEYAASWGDGDDEPPENSEQRAPAVLSKNTPYESAGAYIRREARDLKHYNDDWLSYDGAAYTELEDATVRSRVYDFLERARERAPAGDGEWKLVPFHPNTAKVNQVIDALGARAHVERDRYTPPCWLDGEGPPPGELIACRNGLLHLPTGELHSPTPRFFTRNALDFAYEPSARAAPEWLRFLATLWGDDIESIATLQDVFGYLLVPDTRLQKAFLLVGPPRSGKGTIGQVLTALVGRPNTCAPTLLSLSESFGLQPLIGKQLAIVSDLRLGPKTDRAAIAENLLRITGEDLVTAARKYKREWTGRLSTRFVIMTNEVPRFADASGALANRFVPLVMVESFLGREDPGLVDRLLPELPAILNWAVDGWRRLRERGYFEMPEASRELVQEIADAASPEAAFAREECEIAPDASVEKTQLYASWKAWCDRNGHRPGTAGTFGRNLIAAIGRSLRPTRPREAGRRRPHYEGIRLLGDDTPF